MDGMMVADRWLDICELDAIPVRGARRASIAGVEVAIFRTATDDVFAVDNSCPHKNGPLSDGIVHGSSVTCPLHNLIIDLKTGQGQEEGSGCTKAYQTKVLDGRVLVKAS